MKIITSKFVWLGEPGDHGTHLFLEPEKTYPTSAISAGILIAWAKEGKLKFIEEKFALAIPMPQILDVQDMTIGIKNIVIKQEKDNG